MCISAFETFSGSSNSFVILFIHSAFLLCSLGCHNSVQHCSVSLTSHCWYIFVLSPPFVDRIFLSLFWNVPFCLYFLPFNIPSFPSTFWFISFSCIFPCVAFFFLSLHVPSSFLCFILLAYFRRFFICVSSRIFHHGFDFFFVLFEGIKIFSQTLPWHRLVNWIWLYHLLIYKLEFDLFLPFPSWLFSILCFLVMERKSFPRSLFSLDFLDLLLVFMLVFTLSYLIVCCLIRWRFYFLKLAVHYG